LGDPRTKCVSLKSGRTTHPNSEGKNAAGKNKVGVPTQISWTQRRRGQKQVHRHPRRRASNIRRRMHVSEGFGTSLEKGRAHVKNACREEGEKEIREKFSRFVKFGGLVRMFSRLNCTQKRKREKKRLANNAPPGNGLKRLDIKRKGRLPGNKRRSPDVGAEESRGTASAVTSHWWNCIKERDKCQKGRRRGGEGIMLQEKQREKKDQMTKKGARS